MFAIKDIESLRKLSWVLAIPFFAAAYIFDGALETIHDPFIDWLRNFPHPLFQISGWAFWLLIVVAVVAIIFLLIDSAIVWLHVKTGEQFIMVWVGFTSLTAGLFILCYVFPKMPISPLNPFWHLGFLAYGLSLVDRAAKP